MKAVTAAAVEDDVFTALDFPRNSDLAMETFPSRHDEMERYQFQAGQKVFLEGSPSGYLIMSVEHRDKYSMLKLFGAEPNGGDFSLVERTLFLPADRDLIRSWGRTVDQNALEKAERIYQKLIERN